MRMVSETCRNHRRLSEKRCRLSVPPQNGQMATVVVRRNQVVPMVERMTMHEHRPSMHLLRLVLFCCGSRTL